MNIGDITTITFDPHLPYCFQERLRLNIAYRSADLDQCHVSVSRALHDTVFDLVGNMGNHLYGGAKIVAAAFLLNDAFIDTAGRIVIALGHGGAYETLIMT